MVVLRDQVYRFDVPAGAELVEGYTFAVVGDLGQTANSASTVDHMLAAANVSMVVHPGDLSYANCVQPRWDS